MVKITIENLAQKEVFVSTPECSVLKAVQGHFIDWMHACGGKGRCTTCKFIVLLGAEQLSPPTKSEEDYRKLGELQDDERLACQTIALGDCKIRVPDEYKLPHVVYSN